MDTTSRFATVAVFAGTFGVASSSSSSSLSSSSTHSSPSSCSFGFGFVTTLGVLHGHHNPYRTRS